MANAGGSDLELQLDQSFPEYPALVREALRDREVGSPLSASLSSHGWCWLVDGRNLFLWRYDSRPTESTRSCNLHLPASGLQYTAKLIAIYQEENMDMPGVLAVSPEGTLRFWKSAGGQMEERTLELHSQVVHAVSHLDSRRFLLSTTTSSFYVIDADTSTKHVNVHVKTLHSPTAMSGIGRRVSSLFFTVSHDDTRLLHCVPLTDVDGQRDGRKRWALAVSPESVKLLAFDGPPIVWICEATTLFASRFLQTIWRLDASQSRSALSLWLIDAVQYTNGILLLCAACNASVSPDVRFALGWINQVETTPRELAWFAVVNLPTPYKKTEEESFLCLSLYAPRGLTTPSSQHTEGVLIVSSVHVVSILLPATLRDANCNRIQAAYYMNYDDDCLGTGCDNRYCYVFLRESGLVAVRLLPAGFDADGVNESIARLHTARSSLSSEDSTGDDDETAFRDAFIHFARKDLSSASVTVQTLVSRGANLAQLTFQLSRALVDEVPVSDERWSTSSNEGANLTGNSLLIFYQLKDKKKTFNLLVTFLRTLDLFQHLSGEVKWPSLRGSRSARSLLAEHAEKLEIALVLHEMDAKNASRPSILDAAIAQCQRASERQSRTLTSHDLFYREVTTIDSVFTALLDCEESSLSSQGSMGLKIVQETGRVFLMVANAIERYRAQSTAIHVDRSERWTARDSVVRPFTSHLHCAIEYANTCSDETGVNELWSQMRAIGDFLLAQLPAKDHMDIVGLFIDADRLDHALHLAEKHAVFAALIRIAESRADYERDQLLAKYKQRFVEHNFTQFLYKHYLDSDQKSRLLSERADDVDGFLAEHDHLNWIRDIKKEHYEKASATLNALASRMDNDVKKKKTALSLAKLTALAAENPDFGLIAEINDALQLIHYQLSIPEHILQTAGYSLDAMPALSVEEVIRVSIGGRDPSSHAFLHALQLIANLYATGGGGEQRVATDRLRCDVWLTVVRETEWTRVVNAARPQDAAKESLYGQVLQALVDSELDVDRKKAALPSLERLVPAVGDEKIAFFLKAGDELARRLIAEQARQAQHNRHRDSIDLSAIA